jgi:hypothetical protein
MVQLPLRRLWLRVKFHWIVMKRNKKTTASLRKRLALFHQYFGMDGSILSAHAGIPPVRLVCFGFRFCFKEPLNKLSYSALL